MTPTGASNPQSHLYAGGQVFSSEQQSVHRSISATRRAHRGAAGLVLLSALLYSVVPLGVHVTASESNPFLFNGVAYLSLSIALMVFLRSMTVRLFGDETSVLRVIRSAFEIPQGGRSDDDHSRSLIARLFTLASPNPVDGVPSPSSRLSATLRKRVPWLFLPMFWLALSRLEYALFVWSTQYLEVAVATTIFELWPIVMVLTLARMPEVYTGQGEWEMTFQKKVLMGIAFLGLSFVILGQSDASVASLEAFLTASVIGVALALTSAVFTGVSPAANLVYGELLYTNYRNQIPESETHERKGFESETQAIDSLTKLWFTAVGLLVSCLISIPLSAALSFASFTTHSVFEVPNITPKAVLGALGLGLIFGGGAILLRIANIRGKDLGINALYYITPLLSLLWLSWDISLPRPDLFWLGAILVLAVNALIQSSPDEESSYSEFGVVRLPGVRMGFTSLILSLWVFGAIIYLRDEVMPPSWLIWQTSEYWAVVALSATIFALIFGFRVARLSARLSSEDRIMMRLFRRCEHLVRIGESSGHTILDEEILDDIRRLDVSSSEEIQENYELVRNHIRNGQLSFENHRSQLLTKAGDGSLSDLAQISLRDFFELQEDLDDLAHTKQKGKDFSELLAIIIFAGITIVLGLMARPAALRPIDGGWNGYLEELFTTLFVSVIAFLAFHLLDMRRDGQLPLIVLHPERHKEYILFFRHKSRGSTTLVVSLAIVSAMIVLFASLLYSKWLW